MSHSVSHYFQDVSRGVCDMGDGSNSPAVSLLIVMSNTLSSPRVKQPIKKTPTTYNYAMNK